MNRLIQTRRRLTARCVFFTVGIIFCLGYTVLNFSEEYESVTDDSILYDKLPSVDNYSCDIPTFTPWDPSVLPYLKPPEKICSCQKQQPLLIQINATHLKFDRLVAFLYYGATDANDIICHGSEIVRTEKPDNYYKFQNNFDFSPKEFQEILFEFTFIQCDHKKQKNIYSNIYFTFPVIPNSISRNTFPDQKERLSVLVIGIDSLSRLNFIRTFDKTKKIINEKSFLWFDTFTKVGSHTMQNMYAMLRGYQYDIQPGWKDRCEILNNCHFIWEDFKKNGYLTSFYEDRVMWNHFYPNRSPGFQNEPFDYYYRAGFLALEHDLKHTVPIKSMYMRCSGDRFNHEIIIDAAKNFATRLKDYPYFSIFWTADCTHDDLNGAYQADRLYEELFEQLFSSEDILNNTIVFFISDHGIMYGKFRETYMGWLEERMPLYTIWFPEWFKKKYPVAVQNLETNTNRLTSTFDTHKTWLDILNNDFSGTAYSEESPKKGISLFRPIPKNRTCTQAGIPPEFCTCTRSEEVNADSEIASELSAKALSFITNSLKDVQNKCAVVYRSRIISVRLFYLANSSSSDYTVTFETSPAAALFEATIRLDSKNNKNMTVLGEVSRINKFGNQSYCVSDPMQKMYCYCL